MRFVSSVAASAFSRASAASTAAESRRPRSSWTRSICARSRVGVDVEELDVALLDLLVAVHADDDALAALQLVLEAEGRLGDLALEEVLLDRGDHAAQRSIRSK